MISSPNRLTVNGLVCDLEKINQYNKTNSSYKEYKFLQLSTPLFKGYSLESLEIVCTKS